jgi:predicted nucleic acid-binding protein
LERAARHEAEKDSETDMADARRNQGHLGIDTNVLVAYLDADHPSHSQTKWLAKEAVALNPTVIHEAYHTMVFKMRWVKEVAAETLLEALGDDKVLFISQSERTTKAGLRIAVELNIGGRDALILASFLVGRIHKFITFDAGLLKLGKITHGRDVMTVIAPSRNPR